MKPIVPITLAAALALSSAVFFWRRRNRR
ncbi:LPXTG cell wall anchor domain-containing protein [Pseudoflavonifractor sp. 60]|nr:LPXTG cell wall anchor domain-containing protein [Pseudoflavonifractor sp. 60]